ncbi:MAG: hypothetical protein HGB35_07070 [Geobacteraceae bacterium]|nr:hypothetical protein [Geobacteraceae bacterium]
MSFSSTTPGVCTVTGSAVTAVSVGTCTVAADQAGNGNYNAAPQTTQNIAVSATVPGAPVIGTATPGNGQATVTFTAPASNGGSAITLYTVTSSGGQFATGTASPITVTGLTNGTAYTFTVTATNAIGTGPASAISNSVTPATVPGMPTIGTATAGNAQATVAFSPPASNGGSPITSYTVTSIPGNITATGAASPIIVTGLTNGTAYKFTVTATNAVGTGSASNESNTVTPSAVPTAPTGLAVTASLPTASPLWVKLDWVDNATDETGFTIQRATNSTFTAGLTTFTVGANVTTYTNTPVSGNIRYYYRVRAYNASGVSAFSSTVNVIINQPPPAPTSLTQTGVTATSATIRWTDNASNESGFYVERSSTASTGPWTRIATRPANTVAAPSFTTYSNTGLVSKRTYWYRVQSYNAGGTSAYTNVLAVTTP